MECKEIKLVGLGLAHKDPTLLRVIKDWSWLQVQALAMVLLLKVGIHWLLLSLKLVLVGRHHHELLPLLVLIVEVLPIDDLRMQCLLVMMNMLRRLGSAYLRDILSHLLDISLVLSPLGCDHITTICSHHHFIEQLLFTSSTLLSLGRHCHEHFLLLLLTLPILKHATLFHSRPSIVLLVDCGLVKA